MKKCGMKSKNLSKKQLFIKKFKEEINIMLLLYGEAWIIVNADGVHLFNNKTDAIKSKIKGIKKHIKEVNIDVNYPFCQEQKEQRKASPPRTKVSGFPKP